MEYIYSFLIIAVFLIIGGILLYVFLKVPNKVKSVTPASKKVEPVRLNQKKTAVKEPGVTLLSPSAELIALRGTLMTMVMGSERVYKSNLEIARMDFSRRSIQNPSETELLNRAIEILRNE